MSGPLVKPRIGFLGLGWIGRHRLEALVKSDLVEVTGLVDPSPEMLSEARRIAPEAPIFPDYASMLNADVDSVVIATPSSLHEEHAKLAIEKGKAVFCQKPLALRARAVERLVNAAETVNAFLAVDFCYRHTRAMEKIQELLGAGEIGDIYAIDLVFHNAYGPDKPWFYQLPLSGGGCVMDLGVHLIDLAFQSLKLPIVESVSSRLYSKGKLLGPEPEEVEDFAIARLDIASGPSIRLACSWRLPIGKDCAISAEFFGTRGALALHNVNGSFYDFRAEHFVGTKSHVLFDEKDNWGGRAIVQWAERLAAGSGFDPEARNIIGVAAAVDSIYGRVLVNGEELERGPPLLPRFELGSPILEPPSA